MIKIRIECESKDIKQALEQLEKDFNLISVSKEYKNRNNNYVRVYVDADAKKKRDDNK